MSIDPVVVPEALVPPVVPVVPVVPAPEPLVPGLLVVLVPALLAPEPLPVSVQPASTASAAIPLRATLVGLMITSSITEVETATDSWADRVFQLSPQFHTHLS